MKPLSAPDDDATERRRHAARRTALIIGIVAVAIFVLSIFDTVLHK